MKLASALLLCMLGALSRTETPNNRLRRATEAFLNIVGERLSSKNDIKSPILPVQLPIQLAGHDGTTLPVLIVPVPVYTNNPDSCSTNQATGKPPPAQPDVTIVQMLQQLIQAQNPQAVQPQGLIQNNQSNSQGPGNFLPTMLPPLASIRNESLNFLGSDSNTVLITTDAQPQTTSQPIVVMNTTEVTEEDIIPFADGVSIFQTSEQMIQSFLRQIAAAPELPAVIPDLNLPDRLPVRPSSGASSSRSGFNRVQMRMDRNVPASDFTETLDIQRVPGRGRGAQRNRGSSRERGRNMRLNTGARASSANRGSLNNRGNKAQDLPAMNAPERLPITKPSTFFGASTSPPPRPDFNRSLHLRVDLTVPSSGYTEAYDIQWHTDSNTAKTAIEDGSTTIYRAPLADGRIQYLEMQRELTNGTEMRRCTLSPLIPVSPTDEAFPGLPALDQFEFVDYTTAEGRSRVERWRRVITTAPGEGGAAEGEILTFTHEMLIVRDWGQAVPLRYTVVTDSSVLGPNSDSYTHRYSLQAAPTAAMLPDMPKECDKIEEFQDPKFEQEQKHEFERHGHQKWDKSVWPKMVSRFDPIREFAGPTRDIRYDAMLSEFKNQYKRNYSDPAEEALRKNLFIRSSRFIEAGNRLASGFKMAPNFLVDRLDDEINQLFGVQEPPESVREPELVQFPYSDSELMKMNLEDEFDWRPLGAVSPVRFQQTCRSCWAFAVAASVEGALFMKTKKLVPLSPQCLLDCGKPFRTNGCNGTWPSFAYDYVKSRGLPSWDDYTNYQAKVLECKDMSVPPVTHISGQVNVTANSEAALKVAIKNHAPSVVIVDATAKSFIYYQSGILRDKRCGQSKRGLNHAALAVGWGSNPSPHFILKNTWTSRWGEGGYIRVAPDSCSVLARPSYPLIEASDIDREDLRPAGAVPSCKIHGHGRHG